jgi:bifunctional non-homologous end joining protein LigD
MNPLLEALDDEQKKRLKASSQPDWIAPMLATLSKQRFSDGTWIFERKFDGERCLVFRKDDTIRLMSRNKKVLNTTYPEFVEAFTGQEARDFIADGEIVALEGDVTRFSRLQERIGIIDRRKAEQSPVAVTIYLFDLLYFDGYDITGLELRIRKSLLANALSYADPIRYTRHRDGDGLACYEKACQSGWEGIITKRAASRYVHRRSLDWLKYRCLNRQEFVIGGYTDPAGSRAGFGALLIGYYEGDILRYAGKVGTGFDERLLILLGEILTLLEQKTSPFADKKDRTKGEHWVSPEIVCEIAFTEWTESGKLRHPRFLGIRNDKDASRVVREWPEDS